MRDLPLLIFEDVAVGSLLFAFTWICTRRSILLTKCAVAVGVWLACSMFEGAWWAVRHIDYYYPRPASPFLVPAHLIFAGLWIFAAIASLSRGTKSRSKRAALLIASVLVSAGAVVAVQWPREADMSYFCEDHLRNQWLALHWYAEKHDGKLPPKPGTAWARLTSPYYTYRSDLLRCPEDDGNSEASYLLTPQAAGKSLNGLGDKAVLLLENSPRHHDKAHALLRDGEVIEVGPRAARISQK